MQSLLLKFLSELRLQIYNYVMPAVPLSKPRSQYSWRIEVRVAGDRSILRGGTVYGQVYHRTNDSESVAKSTMRTDRLLLY